MRPQFSARAAIRRGFITLLAIASPCVCLSSAEAANKTWLGTFGGSWNDPANWSGNALPVNDDILLWTSLSGNLSSNNDISALRVSGLTFTNAPGPVTLGGTTLTMSPIATSMNVLTGPTHAVTINFPLQLSNAAAGSARILTMNTSAGGALAINGVISESGTAFGITVSGGLAGGEASLGGLNTFTGQVQVNTGTLAISSLGLAGTAQSLGFNSQVRLGYRTTSGTGNIGTLRYTGPATTSNLRLQLGDTGGYAGAGGGFLNDGTGAVIWTGSMATQSVATTGLRPFTLGGTNADNNTWQAPIVNVSGSAAVSLSKTGSGKWILSGTNTYSGATSITGGLLEIASAGSINSTSGITINGGHFKYNSATALNKPITFTSGMISGTGSIGVAVTAATSNVLSPGNSPGTQNYTAGLTWASGGTYLWEIGNWTGSAGSAYDQLVVSGATLDISATSGSPFTIKITSLTGTATGDPVGNVPNFTDASRTFTIATTSSGFGSGANAFDASKFTLDTSSFSTSITRTGSWSISATGSTVLLNYTVPSTTNGSYSLSASAGAASIIVGGTSTITATLTNTGTGTADALNYSTLAVGNGVTISPATGSNLALGASGTGTGLFAPVTAGTYTLTPTATVTNVTAGGSPTQTGTTSAIVTVYDHSNGSLAGGVAPVTSATISLGEWNWQTNTWTSGSGSNSFSLFNLASTTPASLTASLDVTGTSFTGDSGFTTTFDLASYSLIAGGSSANYFASFTPSGTTSGTFTATFTFNTADQNLPGKTAGAPLTLTATVVVVPEPTTIVLAGLGVGLAGLMIRRRRRLL